MIILKPRVFILAVATAVSFIGSSAVANSNLSSIHGISDNAPVANKYALFCGGCHGLDGMGEIEADVPQMPPNIGAFLYDEEGAWYMVNVGGVMSAGISDKDAADIMNYVITSFGANSVPNSTYRFTEQQIAKLRKQPPDDLVKLRRDIAKRLEKRGIALPDHYPWN
ncbi:cytochrome c [Alteromonas sp. C1M14]|uniref:c-type cytochrome n=1 Tax=Alteromonas sp. C1M14 TaxID=2841567 RepID=UPI001C09D81D|nr:cytochrome c [Alteromonas sp. C1M14]MBU2979871.1 cytochrome c [Alteromonas sp. C1M14]